MNKTIKINGRNNINKIKHKTPQNRLITKKWKNKNELLKQDMQILYLNNIKNNINFIGKDNIIIEIKNKQKSYMEQDIKMARYDPNELITNNEIIDMLLDNNLKCYYCLDKCLLMYEKVRNNKQWTLDRLNNDIGHYKNNVVICCLSCNLKKRLLDDEKFKWGKQLTINKLL